MIRGLRTQTLQYTLTPDTEDIQAVMDPDVDWTPVLWFRRGFKGKKRLLACRHRNGSISLAVRRWYNNSLAPIARLRPVKNNTLTVDLGPLTVVVVLVGLVLVFVWGLTLYGLVAAGVGYVQHPPPWEQWLRTLLLLLGVPALTTAILLWARQLALNEHRILEEQLAQWFGSPVRSVDSPS